MNSGIYALYWWEQDLVYVGLSQDLSARKYEHFKLLNKNKHTNYKVQKAYNLYSTPEFIVLEYCPIPCLAEKEKYWCQEFNALGNNGLCLVEPGIVGFGVHSNASKYSKFQILKVFSLLYKTSYTHRDISEKTAVSISTVSDIKNAVSHLWLQDAYPEKYFLMRNRIVPISQKSLRKTSTTLISPAGELVEVFNIREFAKINNLHNTCLGEVIRGKRKSHKGYKLAND